jgi:hypothetical protein
MEEIVLVVEEDNNGILIIVDADAPADNNGMEYNVNYSVLMEK